MRKKLLVGFMCALLAFSSMSVHAEETTITITFVGDCTLGGYRGQPSGRTYHEYFEEHGADYFFDKVRYIFESDNVTFINLEGSFSETQATADKKFPIRCEPEHLSILTGSSIEVANLANNHSLDCGREGLDYTKKLLYDSGISYCGDGEVATVMSKGKKLTFLGYNGWSASEDLMSKIKSDIENARASGSDLVFVEFHWGTERENVSNSTQEMLGRHAIDCGADMVVGSHPHVIQGIELYKGKIICYSLGNFSFGANKNPDDKDTYVFQMKYIIKDDGSVEPYSGKVIPCSISSETDKNNYQPVPLTDWDMLRVLKRLTDYSSKYEYTLKFY